PRSKGGPPLSRARVAELARRQIDLIALLQAKVVRDEKPGPIHDLRVATRRLQQILDTLFPKPHTSKVRKVRRTLRRARKTLSEVRNCDVLRKHVEQNLGRKRQSHHDVWVAVEKHLKEQRKDLIHNSVRKLGKLNFTAWHVRVKELLESVDEKAPIVQFPSNDPGEIARTPSAPVASRELGTRELLARSLSEAWTTFDNSVVDSQKNRAEKTIHAVRIAAKKLRYQIEVLQALKVAGSGQALKLLRQLQQQLG